MNVAGRDVQAMDQLTLVLAQGLLIKLVRGLEIIARKKQIQVKRVFRVWAVIHAVEDCPGRAPIMQHRKFRRIEEATRTLKIKRNEVSYLLLSVRDGRILADRAKGSVCCTE